MLKKFMWGTKFWIIVTLIIIVVVAFLSAINASSEGAFSMYLSIITRIF